jgi:ubiquinone/menaquinone biosynthesis C-methylase UbiE
VLPTTNDVPPDHAQHRRASNPERPGGTAGVARGVAGTPEQTTTQDDLLQERYRSWADTYDRAFDAYSAATLSKAVEFLGDELPHCVLDLACGTGLLMERLLADPRAANAPLSLIGVDFSEDMLERARGRFEQRSGVRLLHGRAEQIPVASRSVDAVVVANAFHLVGDPQAALDECRRVLRPGGTLVLVDWCIDALPMRLLALGLAATQRLRRRIIGIGEQRAMLERAGFAVRRAERFRAKPMWGLMALAAEPVRG